MRLRSGASASCVRRVMVLDGDCTVDADTPRGQGGASATTMRGARRRVSAKLCASMVRATPKPHTVNDLSD